MHYFTGKSPNIYHTFALFDPPRIGNLMIPCQRIWVMFTWLSDLFCEFFVCQLLLLHIPCSSERSLIQYFHAVKRTNWGSEMGEHPFRIQNFMIWVNHLDKLLEFLNLNKGHFGGGFPLLKPPFGGGLQSADGGRYNLSRSLHRSFAWQAKGTPSMPPPQEIAGLMITDY